MSTAVKVATIANSSKTAAETTATSTHSQKAVPPSSGKKTNESTQYAVTAMIRSRSGAHQTIGARKTKIPQYTMSRTVAATFAGTVPGDSQTAITVSAW